ncbi:MAG TPA: STAS domain-containing protein [Polyangiaceae bacterium]|nr:STAS domain-containing protein [Polyangiaceae bacterium]
MDSSIELSGDIAVVTLFVDELDASNSAEFKQLMAPVLAQHTKLVLDLERVRFIDSSGLGAMLSCLRQLSARGGDLKLCSLSKTVRSAFELVRLHRVLDILPTRADAVKGFRS